MKDVTEFSEADKRKIEEVYGVTFEYFAIEQQIHAQLAEFYQLSIELRHLRAMQDQAVDAAISASLGRAQPEEAQQDREERAAFNAAETASWQHLANEQRRQGEESRNRKLQEQADVPIPRLDELLDLVGNDEGARIEYVGILNALDADDPRVHRFRSALAARLH